jgi:putative endopeptidase
MEDIKTLVQWDTFNSSAGRLTTETEKAVNYGGIGAVIGHQISHAFDDSGSRFGADGNGKNWWTEEDLAAFTERGDALAAEYDAV